MPGKRTATSCLRRFRARYGWPAECDVFVAEVSGSSFGLGFETGYLLGATQKKTILFYERAAERRISLLIVGNTHRNCILVPYSGLDGLEDLVRQRVSSSLESSASSCAVHQKGHHASVTVRDSNE